MIRAAALAILILALTGCQEPVRRGPIDPAPQATGNGGTLYVADQRGRLHAVNDQGVETWVYALSDANRAASQVATADIEIDEVAVAPDGTIVMLARATTGTKSGTIYLATVAPDGAGRWHRAIDQPTSAARPIAIGRDVYVAGLDGSLRSYALADGHDLWRYTVSGAELGSPRVGGDGTIYVRGARGRVHALSPEGTELWAFDPQ